MDFTAELTIRLKTTLISAWITPPTILELLALMDLVPLAVLGP